MNQQESQQLCAQQSSQNSLQAEQKQKKQSKQVTKTNQTTATTILKIKQNFIESLNLAAKKIQKNQAKIYKYQFFSLTQQRLRSLLKKYTGTTTKEKDGKTYYYKYSELNQKEFRQLKKIIIAKENNIDYKQFNELLNLMLSKHYLPILTVLLIKGCHFISKNTKQIQIEQNIQLKKEQNKQHQIKHQKQQQQSNNSIKLSKHANIKRLDFRQSSIQQIQLSQLNDLENLCLYECKQLRNLKINNCENILTLNLSQTFLNEQQIQQLIQKLPQLYQLNLSKCSSIKQLDLKNHKNLNILDITMQKNITNLCLINFKSLRLIKLDKCLELRTLKLSQMQKMMSVNLREVLVNRIQLRSLSNIAKINFNYIYSLRILCLENCQNLRKVIVNSTQLQDLQLNNLHSLEYINVAQCLSLKNIKILDCIKIQKAILQNTNITDDQLQYICKNMPNLQHLNIHCCFKLDFNKSFNFNMQNCKKLKVLNIRNTKLNELKLNNLVENFSQLEQLNIKDTYPSLKTIQLRKLPKLKKLQLDKAYINQIVLENVGISTINWHKHNYINLKKVHIIDCPHVLLIQVNCRTLQDIQLQKLPKLQKIYLEGLTKNQLDLNSFPKITRLKLQKLSVNALKLQKLQFINQIQLCFVQTIRMAKYQQNKNFKTFNFNFCNIKKLTFFYLQQNYESKLQERIERGIIANKIGKGYKQLQSFITEGEKTQFKQQQNIKEKTQLDDLNQKYITFSFISNKENHIKVPYYSTRSHNSSSLKILAFDKHLNYLKQLYLNNNYIDNVEVIGFICKSRLKRLDLSKNVISNLKGLKKWTKLPNDLFLEENKLQTIDKINQMKVKQKIIKIKILKALNDNISMENIVSLLSAKKQKVMEMKIFITLQSIFGARYSSIMDNGLNNFIHL